MEKEKKIAGHIMLGVSAMIGFIIAERIYDAGVKIINRKDVIECEDVELLEESE